MQFALYARQINSIIKLNVYISWTQVEEKTVTDKLDVEQDQLPCGATGTSSGNCRKTETHMVRACHTPQHHLQNHPSEHLGGWVMLRSAEEMLDGQR